MPGVFQFDEEFSSFRFLSQTKLASGAGIGIDDPALFSAQAYGGGFSDNFRSIVPLSVRAGQTLSLDVDFGGANNINPVNTEIWLVDAFGKIVATNDTSAVDAGSTSTSDPKLSFTAAISGLYFVVVAQAGNDYGDGSFSFDNGGADDGVFQLNIGIGSLAARTVGTNAADTLTLTNAQRRFDALGGDDIITGAAASSVIDGGAGNDRITGNIGNDTITGGNGEDQLSGLGGRDVLVGGALNDNLDGGEAGDQLFGGDGGDLVYGQNGNDLLWGEDGSDTLLGGAGNDTVYGGDGDDFIYADFGNDRLFGQAGRDTYYAFGATAGLRVDLGITTAQNTLGYGITAFSGIEDIIGSFNFGDRLFGSGAGNQLNGIEGDDFLDGRGGDDTLFGGKGKDRLFGGAGNDYVRGEDGVDQLTGGTGADKFVFTTAADSLPAERDMVHDFSAAEGDKIDVTFFTGVNIFEFRGTDPFLNLVPEIRVEDKGAFNFVYINVDNDSAPESIIRVNTPDLLLITDFLL